MGAFLLIRPQDDAAAEQASTWCDRLADELIAAGHELLGDVDDGTPPSAASIEAALDMPADLVCYFGHGAPDAWLTDGKATIDKVSAGAAAGKVVVSIACLTSRELGPAAVDAGVRSWLGFTIKVPVILPHKNVDIVGEALLAGLRALAQGATLGDVRDSLILAFDQLAADCDDGGSLAGHPAQPIGYYGALALKDSVEVAGDKHTAPLS